jgi:hypothetical protein
MISTPDDRFCDCAGLCRGRAAAALHPRVRSHKCVYRGVDGGRAGGGVRR